MRVTIVNKYFWPPHLGGVEHSLNMLSTGLAKLPDMGVDVIVANEGRETVREEYEGVHLLRLGRLFAYASTPVALGMRRAIRAAARTADVMHLQFPYPWGELSWLLARPAVPTVLTYHSDIVRQRRLLALYRPLLERVLRRVDRIIVGAPQMIENSPFLAPHAGKCVVVPFGIHTERFAPTPELLARAEELRASHARPVVLFVGRLVYYKGVDVLVRAMADVPADLVCIGTGPLEAELRQLAAALGVADRVTFLPPQPDDELAAWYRAAAVFCLPSVASSEAFGLVQIEAHVSGTPVVSTRLPTGVPFVNADGVSGLTVPPGDPEALAEALRRLVTDPGLRARFGEQARVRALAEFTIERTVRDTVCVYEDVLREGA
ncbi:MAG TPA: glycosyltransferase [Coriobacteriia bacterium]